MTRQIIPYGKQTVDDNDIKEVVNTLKSDWLTQGPRIKEFENEICKVSDAKYTVCVANGTAALHLAALAAEIQPGTSVITSPITFLASANCILYCGAEPVFADIEKSTFNISPLEIEKNIRPGTKALIPVHLGGVPCDMEKINTLAKKNNLMVIEDACHAIGSTYKGTKTGSCKYSDMTVFSFHPVKTIATGEGGAITTNNKKIYDRLIRLRNHGITKDPHLLTKNEGPWYYEMQELGFNYRITDLQCALGISQIKKLASFIEKRQAIIEKYRHAFKDIEWIKMQEEPENGFSAYHLCILNIDFIKIKKTRKKVMALLMEKGIGTQVHYIPVYKQPYYKKYNLFGNYNNAENYYEKALSIPLFPAMTDKNIEYVISEVINLQ